MNPLSLLRTAAVLAALTVVNPAGAQTLQIGAQVFLFQPGTITATLIGTPPATSPNFSFWDTALFYSPQSIAGLFSDHLNDTVGLRTVTPSIPLQTAPLFVSTFFGDPPTGQGEITGSYVSTGFTADSNKPGGSILPNAAVIFGPDHTAQIGFEAPLSPMPASFNDFDVRISLTNVWSGGITPVPEPSTWVLMLIGLLATLMWRRRLR